MKATIKVTNLIFLNMLCLGHFHILGFALLYFLTSFSEYLTSFQSFSFALKNLFQPSPISGS